MPNITIADNKRTALTLFLAGTMLVAGCTAAEEDASEEMDDTAEVAGEESGTTDEEAMTADAMAFESPDADDFNLLLDSRDDLEGNIPLPILNVQIEGEDQLILNFEMESHKCFGIRTTVDETDREIVIGLESGLQPGIAAANCTYGVFPYTAAVDLDAPVGDRTIVVAEPTEPTGDEISRDQTSEPIGSESGSSVVTEEPGEADQLIGVSIEEGVEWAIDNGFEWRVLSFDGEVVAEDSPEDLNRISFNVESDRITSYEWS